MLLSETGQRLEKSMMGLWAASSVLDLDAEYTGVFSWYIEL